MGRIEEIQHQIKELENKTQELKKELECEKQKTKFAYPSLKINDNYWFINQVGCVCSSCWSEDGFDTRRCKIGNIFFTEDEAIKERDRRILLTRFKQFRDECNGDWKPDLEDWEVNKYYLAYSYVSNALCCFTALCNTDFQPFSYFKNRTDCERAIELFGDEIKRLFVEEEK